MKKLTTVALTFFVVAALTTSAFAFGPGWGRGHGGGPWYGVDDSVVSKLNLTSEQMAKINTLREANLKDLKPIQDKMFSKRGELRLLWLQQNPDQDKIFAVQKEVRNLRDQMQDKMTAYRLNVLKVLTPEQQEQLKSYRLKRGFGRGMMGGGFYGGGPGMGMRGGNW